MLKLYLLFCFFLGNATLCYFQLIHWEQPWLVAMFLLQLLMVTIGFYHGLRGTRLNLDTIVWIFVYSFFFLAPVIQMGGGTVFPNTMPIELDGVWQANLVILVWNFTYLLVRWGIPAGRPLLEVADQPALPLAGAGTRKIYGLLALAVTAVTFGKFGIPFFLGYVGYADFGLDKTLMLLAGIVSQGIVLANWLFAFEHRRNVRSLGAACYLALSTLMLLYQISPFNTSRFYLGFCIILVIYLFYAHKLTPGKFAFIMLGGLFLVFPLLNYFRYGLRSFALPSLQELMFAQLSELHFDAYANLIATIRFVSESGIAYGYRLLGALLFFVPRSLWSGKPVSSGETIGDYLSARYALDMSNLSNPLPSEFYFNFGWFGVVAGAAAVALFIRKLENGAAGNRYVHALVAGYLFIFYRGDLMNAFGYCFGTYVVMVLGPALLTRLGGRRAVRRPADGAGPHNRLAGQGG
jgi:hypothetical protein